MKYKPEINKKYHHYTTIDESVQKQKDGLRMFHVICECGKVEYKPAKHLESGRTKSCKSCASKRTAKQYPPPLVFKGVGGLSMTHFSVIKVGAEKRNINFNLDIESLWNLYLKQNKLCALTGVPIILEPVIKGCNVDWSIITASLDRIDNSKGYEVGNVWWVHKVVNRLKNNYSLSELLFWSRKLLEIHGNPDPSVVKEMKVATKEQRLGGEDSTNNPPKSAQPLSNEGEDIV